jgi:hypothetical protein
MGFDGPVDLLVSSRYPIMVAFEPRGERELKGVPGTWAIFASRVRE